MRSAWWNCLGWFNILRGHFALLFIATRAYSSCTTALFNQQVPCALPTKQLLPHERAPFEKRRYAQVATSSTNTQSPILHARNHLPPLQQSYKIDEAGYADILKQVHDGAFEQQLHERLKLTERKKRDAIALPELKGPGAPDLA